MPFEIINRCRDLIGNNKMGDAIELYETTFTDDESISFIKGLSEEKKRLDRQERLGLLAFGEISLYRRQQTARFLDTLSHLKSELSSKHSILFLGASPSTLPNLDIDGEAYKISMQLKENEHFLLRSWLKTTKRNVLSLTNEYKPKILHFACHGKEMGLYLESDPPNANNGFLNLSDFNDVIKNRMDMIECLVLSACESKDIGEQIKAYIPNVIVTNQKIHDSASLIFAEAFYHHIHTQGTSNPDYRIAYDAGMEQLQVLNLSDAFTVEFL